MTRHRNLFRGARPGHAGSLRTLASMLVGVLLSLPATNAGHAATSAHAAIGMLTLPHGSVWVDRWSGLRVNGRDVFIASFSSPMPVPRLAAELVQQLPPGVSLLGAASGVLISWSRGSWLWTLRLQSISPSASRGQLVGSHRAASAWVSPGVPAWLPAGHRLVHHVAQEHEGRHLAQAAYLFATPPASLRATLRRLLQTCGWVEAGPAGDLQRWQRLSATLEVVVTARDGGSALIAQVDEASRSRAGSRPC